MEQNQLTKNLVASSALMTVLAGVIHLVIVPENWAHAPHMVYFSYWWGSSKLYGALQSGGGLPPDYITSEL